MSLFSFLYACFYLLFFSSSYFLFPFTFFSISLFFFFLCRSYILSTMYGKERKSREKEREKDIGLKKTKEIARQRKQQAGN